MGVANELLLMCVTTWALTHCRLVDISNGVKLWKFKANIELISDRVIERGIWHDIAGLKNTHRHTHTETNTSGRKAWLTHTCPVAGRTARKAQHSTAALWTHQQLLWQQSVPQDLLCGRRCHLLSVFQAMRSTRIRTAPLCRGIWPRTQRRAPQRIFKCVWIVTASERYKFAFYTHVHDREDEQTRQR